MVGIVVTGFTVAGVLVALGWAAVAVATAGVGLLPAATVAVAPAEPTVAPAAATGAVVVPGIGVDVIGTAGVTGTGVGRFCCCR